MRQRIVVAGLLAGMALLFVACGGGGGYRSAPTDTPSTAGATLPSATATALSREPLNLPEEIGIGAFYWRTLDRFQSVRAGEPYKVVLRVTSGYAASQLPIIAEHLDGDAVLEFSALRAVPVGPEDEGTFYVFSLELPDPGEWRVTAVAGEAQSSVRVQVQ
jgi:hypothetical protein